MDALKIIATAMLSGLGGAIITWAIAAPKNLRQKQNEERERNAGIEEAVQALLRAKIQEIYLTIMERGYCLPYDKENVSRLFQAYKRIGGNSYVEGLVQQIMNTQAIGRDQVTELWRSNNETK